MSESGHKTARMNAIINAQLAIKKLHLGAKKCITLQVGTKHEEFKHEPLIVDGWSGENVDSYYNETSQWEDTFDEHMKEISCLNSEKNSALMQRKQRTLQS